MNDIEEKVVKLMELLTDELPDGYCLSVDESSAEFGLWKLRDSGPGYVQVGFVSTNKLCGTIR